MTPPIPGPGEGLNAAVAAVLRGERASADLTINQLASKADLTAISVRRYLKAQRHIDVAVLNALAQALGTNMQAIVAAAEARMKRQAPPEVTQVNTRRRTPAAGSPVPTEREG